MHTPCSIDVLEWRRSRDLYRRCLSTGNRLEQNQHVITILKKGVFLISIVSKSARMIKTPEDVIRSDELYTSVIFLVLIMKSDTDHSEQGRVVNSDEGAMIQINYDYVVVPRASRVYQVGHFSGAVAFAYRRLPARARNPVYTFLFAMSTFI